MLEINTQLKADYEYVVSKIRKHSYLMLMNLFWNIVLSNVLIFGVLYRHSNLYVFFVIFVSASLIAVYAYNHFIRIPKIVNKIVSKIKFQNGYYEIITLPYEFLGVKKQAIKVQTKKSDITKDRSYSWLFSKRVKHNFEVIDTDHGGFIILKDYLDMSFLKEKNLN